MTVRDGPVETSQLISPKSTLLLGKALATFNTYAEVKQKIKPEMLRQIERVSGDEVSRDVKTGLAVDDPARVMRSLPERPSVLPGTVLAGDQANVNVLKDV